MQKTYLVAFLAVKLVASRSSSGSSSSSDVFLDDAKHLLELQFGSWKFSDEDHWRPEAEVGVLTKVVFTGMLRATSQDDWMPLRTYLEGLPGEDAVAGSDGGDAKRHRIARPEASVLAEHPWLLDYIQSGRSGNVGSPDACDARADGGTSGGSASTTVDPGSSLAELDVWKETELDRRKFAAATMQVARLPFVWIVLSGAGAAKYKGARVPLLQGALYQQHCEDLEHEV